MNKQTKKHKCIFLLFIIFIFLFPKNMVFAGSYTVGGKTYTYSTDDDGKDGPDVSTLKFELTGFGGKQIGSGVDVHKFTTNSKYGWQEYEVDGVKYVVIGAATHEMLRQYHGTTGDNWFYGAKFDHIHYFHYFETIQFKFEDPKFDSNVYNGMILESGDLMMFPQVERFHREKDVNAFDIYFGIDGEGNPNVSKISGKKVYATMTGVFSPNASQGISATKQSGGNFILNFIKTCLTMIGDAVQILIDTIAQASNKIMYTVDEIQENNELKKEIQLVSGNNEESSTTTESAETEATLTQGVNTSEKNKNNALKEVTISSNINNENGAEETVYSAETKIPIIPVDVLTCSTNQIELFDIDLFNSSSSNSNKIWKVIRNFAAAVSHIILYISAALLLVMLIIRSIMLVIATIKDNPKGAAESKKIMDKWVKAIILIVGIFVLMAAISNLYMVVVDMIMDGKIQKYPIRLTVENICAFNTNVTGYIRYLAEGTNIYASFGYAILYDLVVLFNLIWVLVMFVRLIVIAAAVIIAPITTALMMLDVTPGGQNKKSIFEFKTFITVYTFFVWVPIIAVIIQRLILILG